MEEINVKQNPAFPTAVDKAMLPRFTAEFPPTHYLKILA